ncbi:MAG: toxin-antitoxin system YwqK family antitoxin, partial [Bacteroidia bacterium]
RFGKRHGQWLAFYPTGLLWSECFYDKGLRQGANNVYYENGEPRYKGWYKHDLRDSLWTFYNTGGKMERQVQFKNDEELK